jgi:hypothetical protein
LRAHRNGEGGLNAEHQTLAAGQTTPPPPPAPTSPMELPQGLPQGMANETES